MGGSLLLVAGLSVVLSARKPLTPQEELILRNAEAIAQGENSDWITGYITGSLYLDGYGNMPCCVRTNVATDACDYGVLNCATNQGS
ncbi:MAG TPA: hypothetical protein DEQ30_07020 [Porphyromonadaceae bacterium]|nr:hypothetical protein [Porphyromonadaceae bacterium]